MSDSKHTTHKIYDQNDSLSHSADVIENNSTVNDSSNKNIARYEITIVQPEMNKSLLMKPATVEYSLEEVDGTKTKAKCLPINSNLSQPMYDLYILSNTSQSNVLPMKDHGVQNLDQMCESELSKHGKHTCGNRNRTKDKSKSSRNLLSFLKLKKKKTAENCSGNTRSKTRSGNIFKTLRERSKNKSTHGRYTKLLKSYINKKHARNRHPNLDRVKPFGMENMERSCQYSCFHAYTDTVITESYSSVVPTVKNYSREGLKNIANCSMKYNNTTLQCCPFDLNIKTNKAEGLNNPNDTVEVNTSKISLANKCITLSPSENNMNTSKTFPRDKNMPLSKDEQRETFLKLGRLDHLPRLGETSTGQVLITSEIEKDMEFSTDENNEALNLNHLKLKQDVLDTLRDLIRDESLIQKYNEMKLYANRLAAIFTRNI